MAEVGYGYSRQETINLASDYVVHVGKRMLDSLLAGATPGAAGTVTEKNPLEDSAIEKEARAILADS
ncbi:hypothetical protein DPMN_079789 [Dreissena polymorpha]|uniref:Uncharacterized protein n=1 Tax=Dreissena polymorpha TaxID=45954 RepID=A0A9D3YQ63_DREPO|nr:hypothetical protein DPMN_079789 [Dreissena polymorpha]